MRLTDVDQTRLAAQLGRLVETGRMLVENERARLQRGCTLLCDTDSPAPHHQCRCCNGTPSESCVCHIDEGDDCPVLLTEDDDAR